MRSGLVPCVVWGVAWALATTACGDTVAATPEATASAVEFQWPESSRTLAVLDIEALGTIEIVLYPSLAPATVENFIKLASDGFYDGTTFHRVIPDFMLQGGDPNTRDNDPSNDGQGGPGYQIQDERSEAPHERGVVSMANTGQPNTGGSQFFIVRRERLGLNGKYTVFGRVVSGFDVVDAISAVETDQYGRWGPANRPIENIVIAKIEIRSAE